MYTLSTSEISLQSTALQSWENDLHTSAALRSSLQKSVWLQLESVHHIQAESDAWHHHSAAGHWSKETSTKQPMKNLLHNLLMQCNLNLLESSQHVVNSSQAKASKHQSRTATAEITRSPRSPPLLKDCPRKWADNKVSDNASKINKI